VVAVDADLGRRRRRRNESYRQGLPLIGGGSHHRGLDRRHGQPRGLRVSRLRVDAATLVATLTPSAALAAGQTYTATVTGGTAAVKDTAGTALAADSVWSFRTAAAAGDTVTIQRMEYAANNRRLRVEARSTAANAVLTVFVTSPASKSEP
jgi:hypothetical protein